MLNKNVKLRSWLGEQIDNARLWLVELLAGGMPVALNVTINRPISHKGKILRFRGSDIGLVRPHLRLAKVDDEPIVMTRGLENEAE